MKITVWGINYSPELVGIAVYNTDMCEFLASHGHDVTMVTGFPYYPTWKKRPEDRSLPYRLESLNQVKIWRCWLYVPAIPSVVRRIIHESTFAASSFLKLLTLPAPDIYFVVSPPLILGVLIWLLSVIKHRPYVYHLQDLQPNAALSLGMLKPGLFVRLLFRLQRFINVRATRVSSISQRMCEAVKVTGVAADQVMLLPNWVELPHDLPKPGTWKKQRCIDPAVSVLSYAGNLGVKQGLDLVIAAVQNLNNARPVLFVIAGNGGHESVYKQLCSERGLQNIMFLDVLPKEEHTALLVDSEICLIPQKEGSSLSFMPSKLLKILAVGKPIITNADPHSALHDAVLEGNFGLSVAPGNPEAMAQAIIDLLRSPERCQQLGAAGQQYVRQFDKDLVLSNLESTLGGIVSEYSKKKNS